MPDQRVKLSYGRITMDASLAVQVGGLHLVVLTDAQRYIVRRLLGYAQRESHYYVAFNDDGTYTTPSASEMDDILAVVDSLEDELMSDLTYSTGAQIVSFQCMGGGSITLNPALQTLAWTKIGRQITCTGLLQVQSVISPAGILRLLNLPVACASGFPYYSAMGIFAYGLAAAAATSLMGIIIAGGTTADIVKFAAGNVANLAGDILPGTTLELGFSYFAAS